MQLSGPLETLPTLIESRQSLLVVYHEYYDNYVFGYCVNVVLLSTGFSNQYVRMPPFAITRGDLWCGKDGDVLTRNPEYASYAVQTPALRSFVDSLPPFVYFLTL